MGSGSSITRKVIVDDEFSEGDSMVTKNIPIECPPGRKTTSLKPSGSIGKKKSRRSTKAKPVIKSFSLRSAFSVELEREADELRKELEIYRQNKATEIAELEVRKEKLHSDNQRLRGEIKALQATCLKLKNERAMALEGRDQALQRAAAFEKGKTKLCLCSNSDLSYFTIVQLCLHPLTSLSRNLWIDWLNRDRAHIQNIQILRFMLAFCVINNWFCRSYCERDKGHTCPRLRSAVQVTNCESRQILCPWSLTITWLTKNLKLSIDS